MNLTHFSQLFDLMLKKLLSFCHDTGKKPGNVVTHQIVKCDTVKVRVCPIFGLKKKVIEIIVSF